MSLQAQVPVLPDPVEEMREVRFDGRTIQFCVKVYPSFNGSDDPTHLLFRDVITPTPPLALTTRRGRSLPTHMLRS